MNTSNKLSEVKHSIRLGWEEVAPEYAQDRIGIFKKGAERLVQLLPQSQIDTLLDVGCGSGAVTLQASRISSPRGTIVGSDLAMAMIQQARSKVPANIQFVQMDAERLGFAKDTFNVVTCAFSLFQFPNMDMALEEAWRVLKPGGHLALSNWGPGYFSPIAERQRNLFRKFGIKPLLSNPIIFKPDEMQELLEAHGFKTIEVREETEDILFSSPMEVWQFNMDMGPFPVMLRQQLSTIELVELIDEFKTLLKDLETDQGIKSTFHLLYALADKTV